MVMTCTLAGVIFAGCGDDSTAKPNEDVKIGMITHLNASEQKMNEILKFAQEKAGVKIIKHSITYYDSLTNMQMGLESGNVNEISTYKSVADYLTGKVGKFEVLSNHSTKLKDSFSFAVLKDNTELKNQLNSTLDDLKADGTLEKLTKTYITDLQPGEEPPAVEIEKFEGAETLKVAVTGDLPPLDLVLADGKAAGFNTAMLAEIGKKLHRNIELVNVDSAARATALTSKNVDVMFWAILPADDDRPGDMDKPEGIEFTEPYFTDEIVHIGLKKK